jgi:SMI1/KNR4 family protein SUKH-1
MEGGTMMTAKGLRFPASFVQFFKEQRYSNWDLKENVDAYGHPLETDFEPLDTAERMKQNTAELAKYFGPPDQHREGITPEVLKMVQQQIAKDPSFLFDITDFSKIVQFGRSAGGAPFCFDYRGDLQEPSVILHDDRHGRWRRLAPNFDTFLSLFERYEEEEEAEE